MASSVDILEDAVLGCAYVRVCVRLIALESYIAMLKAIRILERSNGYHQIYSEIYWALTCLYSASSLKILVKLDLAISAHLPSR